MFNFQEIAERILALEGAIQCRDSQSLSDAVLRLYRDVAFRNRLIDNGRLFVENNQGATKRVVGLLAQCL